MSNYQQRLYDHEADPPARTWDKIAAALESDNQNAFAARLYNTTATPPEAVWDRISSSLDHSSEQRQTPVIRSTRMAGFIRYAAAAAIIAAVAVTAFIIYTPKSSTSSGLAGQSTVTDPQAPATTAPATVLTPREPALAAVQRPPAKTSRQSASSPVRRSRPSATEVEDNESSNPLYAYEDHVPDIAERYITLLTPDGSFIRMSKKLGSLLCCVTGQEQDDQCKSQIRKWQEELAASSLGPGNVFDVLDFVNSLNDGSRL